MSYLCARLKKTAFIFALFYLLSVVGYGLEFHYCLGRITDVNLAWLDTSCVCDTDGESVSHSCCHEKAFFVQVEDEHQSASAESLLKIPSTDVAIDLLKDEGLSPLNLVGETFIQLSNAPPDKLYRKHCALIYYA